MPIIKPRCLRDLKLRINIGDVVSRITMVKRVGSRLKGICPFHSEKTPSFHVDPDKGFYKCFGCGKAGDIITFVRETEGLNFNEAIETLARRYNLTIEYEEASGPTREERSLREELFAIHDIAATHFHETFHAQTNIGSFMREYWVKQRKFEMRLADEFKIGATGADGGGLFERLHEKQFSEAALRECGLFFIRDGMPLTKDLVNPRFRGRLMIPIRDHQGRTVAFTARQTELTPESDPAREAKYTNSPETPIFATNRVVFNLDYARNHVKDADAFVIVEGQLDAMRCWSVGIKTAVALMGTNIAEDQLHLLRRYSEKVECLFDSDSPGQKAAMRFLPPALKARMEARFLSPPDATATDPDIFFLERGRATYEKMQAGAQGAMAFACANLLPAAATAGPEKKLHAMESVIELVLNAESEVLRWLFIEEAAKHLCLPPALLHAALKKRANRCRK